MIQSLVVPPCTSSTVACGTGVHAVFQKTETGFPLLTLTAPWKKCTRVHYENTNCSNNAVMMSKYNGNVTGTPKSKPIKTYNNFSTPSKQQSHCNPETPSSEAEPMPSNSTTPQLREKKYSTSISPLYTRGSTKTANTLQDIRSSPSTQRIKVSIITSEWPKSMFFLPTNCIIPSCRTDTVANSPFHSARAVSKKKCPKNYWTNHIVAPTLRSNDNYAVPGAHQNSSKPSKWDTASSRFTKSTGTTR